MKQKEAVIERAKLLRFTWEKILSEDTELTIAQAIASCAPQEHHETREAMAKRLYEIVEASETEEEIVIRIMKITG